MRFHPLDDATRQRFDQDGFLVLRQAIPREQVDGLTMACDRVMAADGVDGRQSDGAYNGFRNAVALDPAIARLAGDERAVSWMTQLLSANIQLHTSQLIYKRTEAAGADPRRWSPGWHRDIHPLPDDLGEDGNRRFEVKIAYYLSPARGLGSGVTQVARGSHRWRERPAFDADGNPSDVVVPELEPGDALLFEYRTWHAARVNTSAVTRKCLILGYSYRWMRPDDWVAQPREVLAGLDEVGRELLTPTTHRDEEGRFTLAPSNPRMHEWARAHGALGSAAWARARGLSTP
jgi:ectoine hydroxylase-related dioxygenase (phytanoyl-CoA dioxygenase family)